MQMDLVIPSPGVLLQDYGRSFLFACAINGPARFQAQRLRDRSMDVAQDLPANR